MVHDIVSVDGTHTYVLCLSKCSTLDKRVDINNKPLLSIYLTYIKPKYDRHAFLFVLGHLGFSNKIFFTNNNLIQFLFIP